MAGKQEHPNAEQGKGISAGVDELIQRLQQDGVEAGQKAADETLAQAELRAAEIIRAAETRAAALVEEAREQARREQRAAEEAMQVAFRDLVLDMKAMLANRFSADVARLVKQDVDQSDTLARLIVAAVGRIREQAELPEQGRVEVLLPSHVVGMDEIRRDPASATEGPLAELAFALQGDMLREGVSFGEQTDGSSGIRLVLSDEQIEVDMSDQAIAELLLGYLQPRFRAILDGIIR